MVNDIPAESDLSLLDRVRLGSGDAMVLLFDRYSRAVYSVALRVLRDPSAAEDVMQDVFLRIWKDAPVIATESGNLRAWFGVLARNRAIDYLRRQRPSCEPDEVALTSGVDLASEVENHLLYEQARHLVQGLSQEQQTVLNMAFFDGLSHSEISARLRSPLGTVKSRIRQALLAIRKVAKA